MRPTLPLLFVLCLFGSACNPCAERCRVESNKIDGCLDDWGLEWTDFGAHDVEAFKEQCVATEQRWLSSLHGDDYRVEAAACSELTSSLRQAGDCEATWESLSGYGAE